MVKGRMKEGKMIEDDEREDEGREDDDREDEGRFCDFLPSFLSLSLFITVRASAIEYDGPGRREQTSPGAK
jgi:hypothetical protein